MTTFDIGAEGTGGITVTEGSVAVANDGSVVVLVDPRVEALARAEQLAVEARLAADVALQTRLRYLSLEEAKARAGAEIERVTAERAATAEAEAAKIRAIDDLYARGSIAEEEHAQARADVMRDYAVLDERLALSVVDLAAQQQALAVAADAALAEVATQDAAASAAQLAAERAAEEAACFCAGTLIATPDGERPVEALTIGDRVLTAEGAVREVRWIGRQTIAVAFADPLRALPVRIAAGALGEGLPRRDLTLSPDHALLVDGVLVQAGALVDGLLVTRLADPEPRFTYFHVELEDQSLILAEGVPAETFVDNVTRERFDNFAEFVALYGDTGPTISELSLPRVKSARQLPRALRDRLADRAAARLGLVAAA
jgi:hypothetical protein